MRSEVTDPLAQVSFTDQGNIKRVEYRRVGRPRGHWIENNVKKAYIKHVKSNNETYDKHNENHLTSVYVEALERTF